MTTYDLIIPTFRNKILKSASLELTLLAFQHARIKPSKVIIINNGEDDQLNRDWLSQSICSEPETIYLEIPDASRAKARNAGVKLSSSEFLLFCDDDIVPSADALETIIESSSLSHFSCGARRRFLAMALERPGITSLVAEARWAELDRLANDTRMPEPNWKSDYRGSQFHSSYVGCFGLVPKWAFENVGGFDERFEGWGLEDTELMRRLLQIVGFRSLRRSIIWHLDHLVSPYIWEEHWGRNLKLYCDRQREKPLLDLCQLFSRDSCESNDPAVLIPPPVDNGAIDDDRWPALAPKLRDALSSYVARAQCDENVAAIVLFGSALRSDDPSDLDIERVLFLGDTSCKKQCHGGVCFDEHTVRLSTLQNTIHKPYFYPDNWPWLVNRYTSGLYMHQKADIRRIVNQALHRILAHSAFHLLTFHLGRLLQSAARPHIADRLQALKDVAVIGCLAFSSFPDRMSYPYTGNQAVTQIVRRVEQLLKHKSSNRQQIQILKELDDLVAKIMTTLCLDQNHNSIYYSASDRGLQALQVLGYSGVAASWGTITNDHSPSEMLYGLYSLQIDNASSPSHQIQSILTREMRISTEVGNFRRIGTL